MRQPTTHTPPPLPDPARARVADPAPCPVCGCAHGFRRAEAGRSRCNYCRALVHDRELVARRPPRRA